MNEAKNNALFHDAPLPGQSWTLERGTKTFDTPSEFSDTEEFLDQVFNNLSKPEAAHSFLAIMSAGAPLGHSG